jgi:hypothetical protein
MRNGVLVGEDSPSTLIFKQNSSTLEETFLSLCCVQESGKVRIIPFLNQNLKKIIFNLNVFNIKLTKLI